MNRREVIRATLFIGASAALPECVDAPDDSDWLEAQQEAGRVVRFKELTIRRKVRIWRPDLIQSCTFHLEGGGLCMGEGPCPIKKA